MTNARQTLRKTPRRPDPVGLHSKPVTKAVATRKTAFPRVSEHVEQATLIRWAALHEKRWPELRLLHAIPNGEHRSKIAGSRLKAEGVRRGVPDLDLPVARNGWHGLRIELKAQGGRVKPEQRQWLADLVAEGYRAEVCVGWESARDLILEYLK